MLKSIGHALFPMALSTGSEVLSDLSKGEKLGSSLKKRGTALAKAAADKALTGSGKRKRKNITNKAPPKKKRRRPKSDNDDYVYPFFRP